MNEQDMQEILDLIYFARTLTRPQKEDLIDRLEKGENPAALSTELKELFEKEAQFADKEVGDYEKLREDNKDLFEEGQKLKEEREAAIQDYFKKKAEASQSMVDEVADLKTEVEELEQTVKSAEEEEEVDDIKEKLLNS